nr:hypothetical protein [uncultured Faecalimonas sp.]
MSKKSKAANEADKIHEVKQSETQEPAVSSALFSGTDFDICEPVPAASVKEADILPFTDTASGADSNNASDTKPEAPSVTDDRTAAAFSAESASALSSGTESTKKADRFHEAQPKEGAEPSRRSLFSRTAKKASPTIEEQILARISDADLMRYLEMEHEKLHLIQTRKETREKRLFTLFQLLLSLAAVVTVVFLLRDNPTVLVNILYITGIIVVLWLVKNPLEKDRKKKD